MKHHNKYLIKALESYPYDLEETVDSLDYALSYDPDNPMALALMGRVYSEIYQDYELAIEYFEAALEENVQLVAAYSDYLLALTQNEDYEKALKFVDFAVSVKSSDKGMLLARRALIYECLDEYKKALKTIKIARSHSYNNDFMSYLDDFEQRIKKKMPKKKGKKK